MKIKTNLPPTHPKLNAGDLHLWFASIDCSLSQLDHLKSILSPDELSRSERFKAKKAQMQFIAGRGILKSILSRYLKRSPNQIYFNYEKMGKPLLSEEIHPPHSHFAFNLTHSHGFALYGITHASSIGVDLEYRKRELSFDEIAQRFFSPAEAQEIQQAQGEYKETVFYHIWTKKEALLKALGLGLHGPLQQFTVTGKTDSPDILPSLAFDPKNQTWFVHSWDYSPEFSFSIAINQKPQQIHFWKWAL